MKSILNLFDWIPKPGRTLGVALFFALVFRSVVSAPYKIPTGSMIPTLKIGDFIFVNKLAYSVKWPFTNKNMLTYDAPKKGEVIVFIYPNEPDKDYIKRVAAVAGDKIDIQQGQLFINGQKIEKRPLSDKSILSDMKDEEVGDSSLAIENLLGVHHVIREIPYRNESQSGICPTDSPNPDVGHGCNPLSPTTFTVQPGHVFVMGDNRNDSYDSRYWGEVPLENVRGKALLVWLSFNPKSSLVKLGGIEIGKPRFERFGMHIL